MKIKNDDITFANHLLKNGFKNELLLFLKLVKKNRDLEKNRFIAENNNKIVVAIHQPAYFGWLGYFHKIFNSDKFIILDDVFASKQSYLNRTLVMNNKQKKFLTIPIQKFNSHTLIKDIKIDLTKNFKKNHLNLILNYYNHEKHFKEIYNFFQETLHDAGNHKYLIDITTEITKKIIKFLNIDSEIYFSSEIDDKKEFSKDKRNYFLTKKINGNIYFSGIAAKEYQDPKNIPNNLRVIYQDFWNYLDLEFSNDKNFMNGLSILDFLFKFGKAKTIEVLKNYNYYILNKESFSFKNI